jgi:hypothetical protein
MSVRRQSALSGMARIQKILEKVKNMSFFIIKGLYETGFDA